MFCENCGAQIMDNSVVCPNCNTPVQPDVSTYGMQEGMTNGVQPIYNYGKPKKSNTAVWIVVILIVLAGIGIGTFFIVRALNKDDDTSKKDRTTKEITTEKVTIDVTTTEAPTTTEATTEETTEETTEITTEEITESGGDDWITGSSGLNETAAFFSTSAPPDIASFDWYTDDVYINDIPSGAEIITNPQDICGGWKCLLFYDPENLMGPSGMQWTNMELMVDGNNNVNMTISFSFSMWEASDWSVSDDSEMDPVTLSGEWLPDENLLWANGFGTIHLNTFYKYNGRQYAIGTYDTEWQTPGYIALVRP